MELSQARVNRTRLYRLLMVMALWLGPLTPWPARADGVSVEPGTVVAWGCNNEPVNAGQCTVPAGLGSVIAIAAGSAHSLALKSDGTVVAWGADYAGETNVPTGLSGVTAIAAGGGCNLALKNDGTVVAWGLNDQGQCAVPVGLSNVIAITAGVYHSLALKSDGTVVAWGCGADDKGQCNVPAGLNGVTAIAGGWYHSLALKSDGTVVAWGDNSSEQLNVPAGLSGVVAIASAGFYSLALKSDGTVVAWTCGDIYARECSVPAGLDSVTAIATGYVHNLALKSDGTVVIWGCGGFDAGQCKVPTGLNNVKAVAAGTYHSLALTVSSPPKVVSITRAGANPTHAANVDFTVTFDQNVSGVDSSDFTLTSSGLNAASVTGVSGSDATRTVTVNTGSGDGTLRLDLVDDDSIHNLAGNPLGAAGIGNGNFNTGEAYTIDKSSPTINITAPANIGYTRGQVVVAAYTCADSGSGVALCAGPVANGSQLDTAHVGTNSFTVNASDNAGNAANASVSYTVISHAPVANSQVVTTTTNHAISLTLVANDVDGDALTYTIIVPPQYGTLSGTAPHLTYTPSVNFSGVDAFIFNANDGQVASAAATLTLRVLSPTALNEADEPQSIPLFLPLITR